MRAIQWNLHYYYNGCVSWSWFYPHHYSPWITDIKDFASMDLTFDKGTPFLPFEQLMAVLPPESGHALPTAYRTLMVHPASPIIDFYPIDFADDLNGKKFAWQAIALLLQPAVAAAAPAEQDEDAMLRHTIALPSPPAVAAAPPAEQAEDVPR